MPQLPGDSGRRILAAAHDAGGCRALSPVLKALESRRVPLEIFADGPAYGFLTNQALGVRRMRCEETREALSASFEALAPALVLVGNSYGPSLEDCFVAEAKKRNIPSVGILDAWLLYDRKFSDGANPWAYLPDTLIVMDQTAKDDMVRLGAPAERLLPLGQPQFDQLAACVQAFSEGEKRAIRSSFGVADKDSLVLFLSQDMEAFYGGREGAMRMIGYTEYMVLELLRDRLGALAARHDRAIHLLVKLHPREDPRKYQSYGLPVVNDADPYPVMLSANLVVGMDTILLMEAGLMGGATLSLQPHRKGPDSLISNRLGLGEYCYHPDDLERQMEALLYDPEKRLAAAKAMRQFPIRFGATERITDWILGALERRAA